MKLKVVSFNIQHAKNYITKVIDYDKLVNTIKEMDPDVIALNEVFGVGYDDEEKSQAQIIAEKLGYNYFFGKATKIKGMEYGNAILSKHPIEEPYTKIIHSPLIKMGSKYYETRNIIVATIKGITFLVTHVGLNDDEQKKAYNKIIRSIKKEKCILMGDLNMNFDNPLVKSIGTYLKDTTSLLRNNKYTYPSDNPKEKLDYIFVSKDIKVESSKVGNYVVSDHKPIESTIII